MFYLLFLALTVVTASADPSLRVDLAWVHAALAAPDPVDLSGIRLSDGGSGLLYAPIRHGHELTSARAFGRTLHARFGYTLVLISTIDGVDVPGFDGLILDRDRTPVANFTLKSANAYGLHFLNFAHGLRRTHAFGTHDKWARYLLKHARRVAGQHPLSETPQVILSSTQQITRFTRHLRVSRILREVFAVGQSRPTWVLVHAAVWRASHEPSLAGALPAESSIARVLVLTGDELRDVTNSCRVQLSAATNLMVDPPNPGHP